MESNFTISRDDKKSIYIIIPAYNEEKRVGNVLKKVASLGYKIIAVNDGSSDNTLNVLKSVQKEYPDNIYVLSHIINMGAGSATRTGLDAALKHNPSYVVTFDADGQHDYNDIANVCEPLISGRAEAVIGARPFEDMPLDKNFANTIMTLLTEIFYHVKVKDSQTGFRAFTASAARKLKIESHGYLISSEFIKEINKNNLKFEEVTIKTIYTDETQKKGTNALVGIKIMLRMIREVFYKH
ncbi:MAG: glycosyltransferase family 2 protein [Methanobacteriaceae archaeon]|jgi:glycosyltransferase involved in cell wall biosynthesis|nr:glycosyltransferase family 2 protein [Methanobacteriaceae archaeon]